METSEVLSALVDGEAVDAGELARALAQPGARETLIDFVRLRAVVGDDRRPSEAMAARARRYLGASSAPRIPAGLRLAAAFVLGALTAAGAVDLARARMRARAEEPPIAARVIRFEPGVDWRPLAGPSGGR